MYKLLLTIISLFAIVFNTINVNAADDFAFSKAPEAIEVTDDSIKIKWENLDGAIMYQVSYDVKSGKEEGIYTNELEDPSDTNEAIIVDLKAGKEYFISVTAIDKEGETSSPSPELKVSTTGGEDTSTEENTQINDSDEEFALGEIKVDSTREIVISFNKSLKEEGNIIEISEKDADETLKLTESKVDGNNLSLIMEENLNVNSSYIATVINVEDTSGNKITTGIDTISEFETPETLNEYKEPVEETPVVDVKAPIEGIPVEETPVEETPVVEDVVTEEAPEENIELEAASETEIEKAPAEEVVEKEGTKKLPKTGPTEILLFLLAMVLGYLIVNRKQA